MRTQSKPHITVRGAWWSVFMGGKLIASWPSRETAWQRYLEYIT